MSSTEHVDAEFVDEKPTRALAVKESTAVAQWTPSFAVSIDEAVARVAAKHDFFKRVMRKDDHYGIIPGTGTKPTLLKPGAELLLANMGLNAEFSDEAPPIIDITGKDHDGEAYIHYRRVCRIYRQVGPTENDRMLVGKASGSCSSWETKYRYRNDKRRCPDCGLPTIIKGKDFSNSGKPAGWVCWKKDGKSDGCGAKFSDDDQRILSQVAGKVPNPDVAEIENTILKMADKRALVAATLIATGCSDIFTQDVEDVLPDPPAASLVVAKPDPTKDDLALLAKMAHVDLSEFITAHIRGDYPETLTLTRKQLLEAQRQLSDLAEQETPL